MRAGSGRKSIPKSDALNWCWRRHLRGSPDLQRSESSILKEIVHYSIVNYCRNPLFYKSIWRADRSERTFMLWERRKQEEVYRRGWELLRHHPRIWVWVAWVTHRWYVPSRLKKISSSWAYPEPNWLREGEKGKSVKEIPGFWNAEIKCGIWVKWLLMFWRKFQSSVFINASCGNNPTRSAGKSCSETPAGCHPETGYCCLRHGFALLSFRVHSTSDYDDG